MILKCGDRFHIDGVEVRIEAMETVGRAVLGLTVSILLDGERVRQQLELPYGMAWGVA